VASSVTVSQKHKCPTSGRKELFCYSVDEKKHFQKDNRRCCGIMVHLAALSTRQLDFSGSSVSLFQHICRNDKNIVAFQHASCTFQVQGQLNYVSDKCPNRKLVILCLTTTKIKIKFSQSMLEFISSHLSVWMERSSWPYFKTRVKVCAMICSVAFSLLPYLLCTLCIALVCSPFARNKLNKKGSRGPEICMATLL
jgi:hypothetical protein